MKIEDDEEAAPVQEDSELVPESVSSFTELETVDTEPDIQSLKPLLPPDADYLPESKMLKLMQNTFKFIKKAKKKKPSAPKQLKPV